MTILTAATVLAGVLLVLILMIRELGFAHLFRRRARRLAADLYAAHPVASSLHNRTTSEAGDPDADRGQGKTATNDAEESASQSSRARREVGAPPRKPVVGRSLEDRLDAYLDPGKSRKTAQATAENGPVKPPPHSGTPADDELEILKAKLGKPVPALDDSREIEVETLKTKLGREIARKGKTTAGNLSKTKLAPRGSLKALPGEPVEAAEATHEPADRPSTGAPPRVFDVDTRGAGADERPRAVDLAAASNACSPTRPSRPTAAGAPEQLLSLEQHRASTCQIVWSRGYLKSLFRAVSRTTAGDVSVIAESPRFRWTKADPPQRTTQAIQAHRVLLEALERDGWSVAHRGEQWYTLELERPQKRRRRGASGDEPA